jgi:hypothetical protein
MRRWFVFVVRVPAVLRTVRSKSNTEDVIPYVGRVRQSDFGD